MKKVKHKANMVKQVKRSNKGKKGNIIGTKRQRGGRKRTEREQTWSNSTTEAKA